MWLIAVPWTFASAESLSLRISTWSSSHEFYLLVFCSQSNGRLRFMKFNIPEPEPERDGLPASECFPKVIGFVSASNAQHRALCKHSLNYRKSRPNQICIASCNVYTNAISKTESPFCGIDLYLSCLEENLHSPLADSQTR